MVRRLLQFSITLLCLSISTEIARAGQVEFFATGTPNPAAGKYAGTIGFGVSDTGVVAATNNLGSNETAFTYTTGGTYYSLAEQGRALGISADGSRVAGYVTSVSAGTGALSWQAGSQNFHRLNSLLAYTSGAAVSADGKIIAGVGQNQMASWNTTTNVGTALGQVTGPAWSPPANFGWAGAVSNTGLVGGTSGYSGMPTNPRVAVIAQAGVANSTQQLGQGTLDNSIANSYAKVLAINTDGTLLVGESNVNVSGNIVSRAFFVDRTIADTLVDMSLPSGFTQVRAQGISNVVGGAGPIVVGSAWNGTVASPDLTNLSAVVWLPGLGPQLLQDVAQTNWGINFTGYRLMTAYSVSTNGTFITGSAVDLSNGNQVGYLISNISPVPEPASFVTLGLGLGIALYARHRRKTASQIG
jgi:hypothetical protein